MAQRYAKGKIELILSLKGYRSAQAAIQKVSNTLRDRLPQAAASGARKARNVFKKTLFGFLSHQAVSTMQTIGSAIKRTLAYGLVNVVRNSMRQTVQLFKEGAEKSLDIARAAAIATGAGKDAAKTYDNLAQSLMNTGKAEMLMTKQIITANKAFSKAGLDAEEQAAAMEELNRAFVITGEKPEKMALQFVKMAQAFKVPKEEYGDLMDKLIVGSTSAAGTINDLLQATKHLGPIMVTAFGDGSNSLDNFISTVMAVTNIGPAGGQASRWLLRMIQELAAPTSRSTAILQKFNIQLYKGGGASEQYRKELEKSSERVRNLYREQDTLNKSIRDQRSAGAGMGDLSDEYSRLSELQDKINKEMKLGEDILKDYRKAGGRIKPLKDIMQEFRDMIDQGKISSAEFLDILRKIFQIRGGKGGAAGVREVTKVQEIYNKLQDAGMLADKKYQEVMENWGPILRTVVVAIDKVQTAMTETFGPGILGPIASMLKESVFDPISESLTDEGAWKNLRDTIKQRVEDSIAPLKPELKHLFRFMFDPKNYGVEFGTEEYFNTLGSQIGKLYDKYIKPQVDKLWAGFREAGKFAARGFIQVFADEFDRWLSSKPLIGRLFSQRGANKTHAEAAVTTATRNKPVKEMEQMWEQTRQFMQRTSGMRSDSPEYIEATKGLNSSVVKLGETLKALGWIPQKGGFGRREFSPFEGKEEKRYPNLKGMFTPTEATGTTLGKAQQKTEEVKQKMKEVSDKVKETPKQLQEYAMIIGDRIVGYTESNLEAARQTGEKIKIIGHKSIDTVKFVNDNLIEVAKYQDDKIKVIQTSVQKLYNMLRDMSQGGE
jgi:hypothetical protein